MERLLTIKKLVIEGRWDDNIKVLIDNVSLHLDRGEVLGLIGESGAGKSTLGLASMGYVRTGCHIASGSIEFDGKELTKASENELNLLRGNRITYVAQSAAASFNPAHRLLRQFVESPLRHGLMDYTQAKEKAIELYRRFNLPYPETIGYRYPHQVSGGQLQRAMIAMAMATNPDLIIFDEPTTALDVTTQIEVLATIKEAIRMQSGSAIYITHDLAVVAQLANRIIVLKNGKLIEEGITREMMESPKEAYTRDLLNVRRQRKEASQPIEDVVLNISNVIAGYTKETTIVKNISLKVHRKRTVAVVGESGSGKTSLARVITGLLPLWEGKIFFYDKELPPDAAKRDRELLRHMQMIYQMPDVALNPRQKIRRILGRPLEFYFGTTGRKKENRVQELLDLIELPSDYYNRYPSELSGGEKQRVCIARALAAEPDLIICDEITSALDQLVAEGILKLLHDLQNNLGVSYLFITHDLATVRAIADEVVVMYQGEIVERGNKRKMFRNPSNDYTKLLLSSIPEMDPDWLDNLLSERQQEGKSIIAPS